MADTANSKGMWRGAAIIAIVFGLLSGSWGLYATVGPFQQIGQVREDVKEMRQELRDVNMRLGRIEGSIAGAP